MDTSSFSGLFFLLNPDNFDSAASLGKIPFAAGMKHWFSEGSSSDSLLARKVEELQSDDMASLD